LVAIGCDHNLSISGVTEQLGAVGHSLALGPLTPPLQQSDCGWLLARMGWHWGRSEKSMYFNGLSCW